MTAKIIFTATTCFINLIRFVYDYTSFLEKYNANFC